MLAKSMGRTCRRSCAEGTWPVEMVLRAAMPSRIGQELPTAECGHVHGVHHRPPGQFAEGRKAHALRNVG